MLSWTDVFGCAVAIEGLDGKTTGTMALLWMLVVMASTLVDAQQFDLVHNYAHHEGSPANSWGRGASPEYSALLKAHDRRRLAGVVADFPLSGDADPTSVGYVFHRRALRVVRRMNP